MSIRNLGTYSVTLECPSCGPTNVKPEERSDDTIVSCASCGVELGTWREVLRKAALKAAMPDLKNVAVEEARKIFKNLR
jgi:uncharacterized Zn finger protein